MLFDGLTVVQKILTVFPENIHTPTTEGIFFCTPSSPRKLQCSFILSDKSLTFKTHLLLLGISNDPWEEYGYFVGPHNSTGFFIKGRDPGFKLTVVPEKNWL